MSPAPQRSSEPQLSAFLKCAVNVCGRVADALAAAGHDGQALARRLVDAVVFLRFVEQGGWLDLSGGFERCRRGDADGHSFWRDVLGPLNADLSLLPVDADAHIPNAAFAPIFDDLLAHFTFTLDACAQGNAPALDPSVLGALLECVTLSSKHSRKRTGSYYTPAAVVEFMSKKGTGTFYADRKCTRPLFSVCDPAAGAGAFLVGMLHELTSTCEDRGERYALKRHVVEHCLYGVDTEPDALRVAERRLWLALLADCEPGALPTLPDLSKRLVVGDSLLGIEDGADGFAWRRDFAHVFAERGGFDVVVTNPPYRSFGLRGNDRAGRHWARLMRKLFPGSAEYKISTYALFLDLALQIAAPGGVVCAITPDSFLLGRYFSKLRGTILDHAAVRDIALVERDFWRGRGVVGRPTITVLQRGAPAGDVTAQLYDDVGALVAGRCRSHAYPQAYFHTVPHRRFRPFFSHTAMEFVNAVEAHSRPLKDFVRITTGIRSRTQQADIVATRCHGPEWKRGIVSGRQVEPFEVQWQGHYIRIHAEQLYAGGWDAAIIERPKILMRQTGDSLIAAVDRDRLYHLNNVHSVSPLDSTVPLDWLCALLNSRLMNRYYHLVSCERGRAMAQTHIDALEQLPVRLAADESTAPANGFARAYGLSEKLVEYLRGDALYA